MLNLKTSIVKFSFGFVFGALLGTGACLRLHGLFMRDEFNHNPIGPTLIYALVGGIIFGILFSTVWKNK